MAQALRQRVRQADVNRLDAGGRSASAQWQPPDTNTARADGDDRAGCEIGSERLQVHEEHLREVAGRKRRTPRVSTTDGDEARCAANSMPKSVSDEMITDASVRTLEDFDVFGHR